MDIRVKGNISDPVVTVRMPNLIHKKLVRAAERNARSLSAEVNFRLASSILEEQTLKGVCNG